MLMFKVECFTLKKLNFDNKSHLQELSKGFTLKTWQFLQNGHWKHRLEIGWRKGKLHAQFNTYWLLILKTTDPSILSKYLLPSVIKAMGKNGGNYPPVILQQLLYNVLRCMQEENNTAPIVLDKITQDL